MQRHLVSEVMRAMGEKGGGREGQVENQWREGCMACHYTERDGNCKRKAVRTSGKGKKKGKRSATTIRAR